MFQSLNTPKKPKLPMFQAFGKKARKTPKDSSKDPPRERRKKKKTN